MTAGDEEGQGQAEEQELGQGGGGEARDQQQRHADQGQGGDRDRAMLVGEAHQHQSARHSAKGVAERQPARAGGAEPHARQELGAPVGQEIDGHRAGEIGDPDQRGQGLQPALEQAGQGEAAFARRRRTLAKDAHRFRVGGRLDPHPAQGPDDGVLRVRARGQGPQRLRQPGQQDGHGDQRGRPAEEEQAGPVPAGEDHGGDRTGEGAAQAVAQHDQGDHRGAQPPGGELDIEGPEQRDRSAQRHARDEPKRDQGGKRVGEGQGEGEDAEAGGGADDRRPTAVAVSQHAEQHAPDHGAEQARPERQAELRVADMEHLLQPGRGEGDDLHVIAIEEDDQRRDENQAIAEGAQLALLEGGVEVEFTRGHLGRPPHAVVRLPRSIGAKRGDALAQEDRGRRCASSGRRPPSCQGNRRSQSRILPAVSSPAGLMDGQGG